MPKKFSDLTEATEALAADIAAISQSGTSKKIAMANWPLPINHIGGLITSNGTDTDHDIDIAVGAARSDDNLANLALAAIWTKQIDVTWAVGDDAGGMEAADHPVQADTLYALWLIKRSDTGVVDAMFSLDFSSPTLPTDYDSKRLIGAVLTEGSANIVQYLQSDNYFLLTPSVVVDVNDSTLTSGSFETGTLRVPPLCLAHVGCSVDASIAAQAKVQLAIRTKGITNVTLPLGVQVDAASDVLKVDRTLDVIVDASSQIEYAVYLNSGNPDSISITTQGFTMLTRNTP